MCGCSDCQELKHCPSTIIDTLKQRLAEAENLLEWYADRNNWKFESYKSDVKDVVNFSDVGVKSYTGDADFACGSGGRRAREYFQRKKGGE